jgi:drug/metabolite transporter (DMT)-like permease
VSRKGLLLFALLSALWGLPYFMIRVAVRQLDPGTLVLARTLPAAVLLLPWAWYRGVLRPVRGVFRWVVLYTVIEFGIPWLLMSNAERQLPSSLTSLIVCATPLFSLAVTRLTPHHEPITRQRWLGLLVGSTGVILVVGLSLGHANITAAACMILVALGYATGPLILRYQLHDVSGLAVVALSVSLVAAAYLPWGVTHWPQHVLPATWWAVAVLTAACTAAAFLIFFTLIQEIGPQRAVVVTYLNTALAVILGVVFLHEALTTGMVIGFPLIVIGSLLATRVRQN